MEQQQLPESMIVMGGGYVGLEQVLRGVFADDGIDVVEQRAVAVERTGYGALVRTASGQEVTAERLLDLTGRFGDTAISVLRQLA